MESAEHIQHLEKLKESLSLEIIRLETMLGNINNLINGLSDKDILVQPMIEKIVIADRNPKTERANAIKDYVSTKASGFRFDPKQKIDNQLIALLRWIGRAEKKSFIDEYFSDGKKIYETRHAIRRLKKNGRIGLVSLGGSKRYTFWALAEWISDKGKISQEHAPVIDGEQLDASVLNAELFLKPIYLMEK